MLRVCLLILLPRHNDWLVKKRRRQYASKFTPMWKPCLPTLSARIEAQQVGAGMIELPQLISSTFDIRQLTKRDTTDRVTRYKCKSKEYRSLHKDYPELHTRIEPA